MDLHPSRFLFWEGNRESEKAELAKILKVFKRVSVVSSSRTRSSKKKVYRVSPDGEVEWFGIKFDSTPGLGVHQCVYLR
jgi:hypothetical protein